MLEDSINTVTEHVQHELGFVLNSIFSYNLVQMKEFYSSTIAKVSTNFATFLSTMDGP